MAQITSGWHRLPARALFWFFKTLTPFSISAHVQPADLFDLSQTEHAAIFAGCQKTMPGRR